MLNFTQRSDFLGTLTVWVLALLLSACGGDNGPRGPTGAAGATGATGPAGATGATGAAGAGVTWVDVTGASMQALPNTGYLADSSAQVTITLPTNAALGDLVEISGVGTGGWKIAQNAGQQVHVGFENAAWSPTGPAEAWTAVATSSDRTHLAAGTQGGAIYTSADGGATWVAQNSGDQDWTAIASSADGKILLAGASPSHLYVSTDSGVTWNLVGPSLELGAIACSPDDSHLIAGGYDLGTSQWEIWTSSNAGTSWTQVGTGSSIGSMTWPTDVELLAEGDLNGSTYGLYVSSNMGSSWTLLSSSIPLDMVAASSDGTHIYSAGGNGLAISNDSGTTWSVVSGQWEHVAASPDGSTVVVAQPGSLPTVSPDFGQTWTLLTSELVESATAFVIGSDDQHIIAVSNGDPFYVLAGVTTAGTAGSVAGSQMQSVTLQYFGNGLFSVIDNEGQLTVQ